MIVSLVATLRCGVPAAAAQVAEGSVSGLVADGAGGVLVAATVTASTPVYRRSAVTGSDGRYRIALPPGRYRLEATLEGFATGTAEGIVVEPGRDAQWNPMLALRRFEIPAIEALAEGFAGPRARQCGVHPHHATVKALERSVSCVRTARARRMPFVTIKHEVGVDSSMATGLVGRGDGIVFRFHYDSSPCGSSGSCEYTFVVEECASPEVREDSGGVFFACDRPRARVTRRGSPAAARAKAVPWTA